MPTHKKPLAQEVLASMNPELRSLYDQLSAEVASHVASNLMFYHRTGKRLEAVRSNPARYGGTPDGTSDPLQKLSLTLHNGKHTVYKSLKFVEIYPTEKEVNRLAAIRVAGRPLTWGHVIALCTIADPVDRDRMEKKIVAEGITDADQLHCLLQETRGVKGGGGRPPVVPKDASSAVRQMYTQFRALQTKLSTVWFGDKFNLTKQLAAVTEEDNKELLDRSYELSNMMRDLAEAMLAQAKKIEAKTLKSEAEFSSRKPAPKLVR